MIHLSNKIKKVIFVVVVTGYVILGYAILQIPDNKFHIYFLNVDQGDSIFIKTPENHQILIDGGPSNFVLEQLGAVMPFFDREIDLMVLTHPHSDHIEGLVEVLGRYKIDNVLLTGVSFADDTYKEFLKRIYSSGINVFIAESSTDFSFGEVKADVIYPLNPISGQTFENLNNSSIGLDISYKNKNIILCGDLESDVEEILLKTNLPSNVEILKASHHGSRTASGQPFLDRLKPKNVVIQVGKNNKFKHPHPEALRNFYRAKVQKIFRTDLDGRVEFVF